MKNDTSLSTVADGDAGFDERGVPKTLTAAKALGHDRMVQLMRHIICDLEDIDDADIDSFDINPQDNSPLIESQLGVDVFNEITQHLSTETISVAGIEEWRWSSVDGLATAVETALSKLKA